MWKCVISGVVCALFARAETVSTEARCRLMLNEALHDKNPDIRKEGVTALSLAGTGEPFRTDLEKMLDDKDVAVRLAVISGIGELKDARGIAALQKALKDEVPEVSFMAARALWQLEDPAGKDALLSVLGGSSKASSGFIKGQTRDAMRMMHTPKTLFLFAIKQGAGLAPVPGLGEGISSLQGILSDAGVSGRATAALLLAKDKDPETAKALRAALTDKDSSVRSAAVHALSLRNDASVMEEFVPLLADKKESVRLRAAAGYVRLETIKNTPPSAPKKPVQKAKPVSKGTLAKKSTAAGKT